MGQFLPLTLRIRSVTRVTARSSVIKIALDGRQFRYRPGQAVMVAAHGSPKRRPFSLAGSPQETLREGALELLVGTEANGSTGPQLPLEPGALLDVDGPIGGFVFPEAPETDRFCFIAGGTGIAPLRAMLHEALAIPNSRITVLYSARTRHDFAYAGELHELARAGRIELHQTVTRESAQEEWPGARGRICRDHLSHVAHDGAALYFVCGPPAFVGNILQLLDELKVPSEAIRTEEWLRRVEVTSP